MDLALFYFTPALLQRIPNTIFSVVTLNMNGKQFKIQPNYMKIIV